MGQQTNLPGLYNPWKAEHVPNQRDMSGVNSFWEWAKTNDPALYQKHLRDDAWSSAHRLIVDAMIDTPEGIKLMDELSALFDSVQQKQFTSELTALGLDSITTKRNIRNAYRRKARKLHPDVGGDAEQFKQLHAAYRTLLKEAHE